MMALVLMPMFASVNEVLEWIAGFVFSYQILLVALNPEHDMVNAFIVIAINIVFLLGLFIFAYKKKGLRGE